MKNFFKILIALILIFNFSACSTPDKKSLYVNRLYTQNISPSLGNSNLSFNGTLYFAGVSFSGDILGDSSIKQTVPNAAALYYKKDTQNPNLSLLNARLRGLLETNYKGKIPIEMNNIASKHENALGVTLLIDYEDVSSTRVGHFNRAIFSVMAQAVIFDFKTKRIVASLPFYISRHYDNYELSPSSISAEFNKIYGAKSYMVDGKEMNVLACFVETLQNADIYRSYDNTVGIANVDINPRAMSQLLRAGMHNENNAKKLISSLFGALLYDKMKVPVLPYTYDSSVYVNLANSFENSSSLQQIILENPSPDFPISLNLRNMKSDENKLDNTAKERVIVSFGINMRLAIKDRFDKLLIENDYIYAFSNIYSSNTTFSKSTSSTESYACLVGLVDEIINEIINDSSDVNLRNLLESCR